MDLHQIVLQLMALQAVLGAFDTLYHHELTEALPRRAGATRELRIHAVRAMIYSVLFIGVAGWRWHGWWAVVLFILFAIEIGLTLWDFVVEDRSRRLPASERITHTILAINGGAFIALLAVVAWGWWQQASALVWQPHGWLGAFLMLAGVSVGLSGLRDWVAARAHERSGEGDDTAPIHFGTAPENVLVTGATGFIGRQLVRALLADGHDVTVLTRDPRGAAWEFEGKVRCVRTLTEMPSTRTIDVVINLAGARILGWRWTAHRREILRDSRIALTEQLCDWIRNAAHKPRVLFSASAIGYYGVQAPGDARELQESAPAQDCFMSDLCRDWEAAAQAASVSGVRVVCMRLGLVLGRDGALPMMLLPVRLGIGGPLGRGSQWLSWIHVDDVLRAIAHLWQAATPGAAAPEVQDKRAARLFGPIEIVNFTAPQSVTQREFIRHAASVAKRPAWLPMPGFPLRWLLGEQSDLLLEGQRVVPAALLKSGFRFRYPAVHSALRSLV